MILVLLEHAQVNDSINASNAAKAAKTADTSVSRWIAWRYLFAGQHQYARFISWVSLIGIGLGVAVLILVLSVMNGFDRELTSRILGTVPHVLIEPEQQDPLALANLVEDNSSVTGAFGFFQGQAMVTRRSSVSPVIIYGVDAEGLSHLPMLTNNADVDIAAALLKPRSIVLGAPLARSLGLLPGDWVMVMVTTANQSRVKPQFERFQLNGTFEVGAEVDFGLALVSLDLMREPGLANTGTFGTRLMLNDPYAAPELVASLESRVSFDASDASGAPNKISHWGETYGELFRAIKLEKAMMFVLLVLIVGIAAFNVVAGQAMLVNDKRGDIAILRTMGAGDGTVLRVFLLQGFLTSLCGVALGVLLGCILALNITALVAWLESLSGARVLEGTYFLEVPSQLLLGDVLTVIALALGIGAIAAFFPAYRSLAVNPVTALHE